MRKIFVLLCLCAFAIAANAQLIKPKNRDSYTVDANGNLVKKDAPAQKSGLIEKGKRTIDAKYLAGACPVRDKRVVWETTIQAEGLSAKQIYDKLDIYLHAFCQGPQQTELSQVSVVDEENFTIGARMLEWLVFEKKPLSLDRTKFLYQLVIAAKDGCAVVTMRNMGYIYEEERGGGYMPAEDMLLDENSINKNGDGFNRGGFKKFRMKTIDRKDEIFAQLQAALK